MTCHVLVREDGSTACRLQLAPKISGFGQQIGARSEAAHTSLRLNRAAITGILRCIDTVNRKER